MFIDCHGHVYRADTPVQTDEVRFANPEEVIARYDALKVEKGAMLPLIGPEVYLPESNEEVLDICERYPGRLFPFCNIDPRGMLNAPEAPLGKWLAHYKERGCRGVGEVMPNLPFLDPRVQNLFCHTQDVGLPLTFDISDRIGGDYGLYDDPGLPQLEESLQKFPRLIILGHGPAFWAEIGRLRTPADRKGYPSYPLDEEGVVPRLFRRYENMWGDLSAGSGYNALARDQEYAAAFLEEFQDRLLFGTDIVDPRREFPLGDLLVRLRDSGKISAEAFAKIARDNAIELFHLEE